MNISHNGLGELVTTFATDASASIAAGTLINLSDGAACAAQEGDAFIGVAADNSRGAKIAVQVGGYVKLEYTGTASYGRQYVVAKTADSIEFCDSSEENAIPVKVISIDSGNSIAGILI